MNTVTSWKNWSQKNHIVAQMDEPLVTKDSRENLHDTSKATDLLTDWRSWYKDIADQPKQQTEEEQIKKATTCFADLICEFLPEIGAKNLYECFVAAATESLIHAEKEYDNNVDLIDFLNKKKK
jgi:hypothetical protein